MIKAQGATFLQGDILFSVYGSFFGHLFFGVKVASFISLCVGRFLDFFLSVPVVFHEHIFLYTSAVRFISNYFSIPQCRFLGTYQCRFLSIFSLVRVGLFLGILFSVLPTHYFEHLFLCTNPVSCVYFYLYVGRFLGIVFSLYQWRILNIFLYVC